MGGRPKREGMYESIELIHIACSRKELDIVKQLRSNTKNKI